MENILNIAAQYPWQMWIVFATILIAITLFMIERMPLELTALSAIVWLIIFFHSFPLSGEGENHHPSAAFLLAGFANPALISILALLVIGQGLFQSEALERPARILAKIGRIHALLALIITLILVFAISAFLNNTPVTVTFIPILAALARQNLSAPQKTMMPLSFACILGGMTTLIGSSTNLLAAQSAVEAGADSILFFTPTIPALMLAIPGLLYVMIVMPYLLPKDSEDFAETKRQRSGGGRQYVSFIEITPGHGLIHARAIAGLFPAIHDMSPLMVKRGEEALLPPFEDIALRAGDTLIVSASRQTLTTDLQSGRDLFGISKAEQNENAAEELAITEAIVAPGSRMIGRSLSQLVFRSETGFIAMGIRRQSRMIRSQMHNIRLEAGDVLLLLGPRAEARKLGQTHDLLPLEWSAPATKPEGALKAALIFAATILAVAANLLPLVTATLLGATAMIASGILNIRQAARSIDRRIILLVASALSLSAALDVSGGANFLARAVVGATPDAEPAIILSALFLIIAIITNVLSNAAAAVLFTPVAVSAAFELGVHPEAFIVTVILAANCSFATPIGHQANLLVMGPGRYRFRDYLKAGGPLIPLLWLVYIFLIPRYYGF